MVLIRPSNEEIERQTEHIHEIIEEHEKEADKIEKLIDIKPFGEDKELTNLNPHVMGLEGIYQTEKDETAIFSHQMDEMARLVNIAYIRGRGDHKDAEKELRKHYPEYKIKPSLSNPDMTVYEEEDAWDGRSNVVVAFRGTELGSWEDYFSDMEKDHVLADLGILVGGESINIALEKEFNRAEHELEKKRKKPREGKINVLRFTDKFQKDEDAFLKVIDHYRETDLGDGIITKFPKITIAGHSLGSTTGYRLYKRFKNYLHDVHLFNVGSNPIIDQIRGSIYKQVVNPTQLKLVKYEIKNKAGKVVKTRTKRIKHFYPKIYTHYTKGGKPDMVGLGASAFVGHHISLKDKDKLSDDLVDKLKEEAQDSPFGVLANLYDLYDWLMGRHSIEHFLTGKTKPKNFKSKYRMANIDLMDSYMKFRPAIIADFKQNTSKQHRIDSIEKFKIGYKKRKQTVYPNYKIILNDAVELSKLSKKELEDKHKGSPIEIPLTTSKKNKAELKKLETKQQKEIKKQMDIELILDDDLKDLFETSTDKIAEKIPEKVRNIMKYDKKLSEDSIIRRLTKLKPYVDKAKEKPAPLDEDDIEIDIEDAVPAETSEQRRRRSHKDAGRRRYGDDRRRSSGRRRHDVLHDINPQSREKLNNIHNNEWKNDNFELHHDIEPNKRWVKKCFYDLAGNWVCKYVKIE